MVTREVDLLMRDYRFIAILIHFNMQKKMPRTWITEMFLTSIISDSMNLATVVQQLLKAKSKS